MYSCVFLKLAAVATPFHVFLLTLSQDKSIFLVFLYVPLFLGQWNCASGRDINVPCFPFLLPRTLELLPLAVTSLFPVFLFPLLGILDTNTTSSLYLKVGANFIHEMYKIIYMLCKCTKELI